MLAKKKERLTAAAPENGHSSEPTTPKLAQENSSADDQCRPTEAAETRLRDEENVASDVARHQRRVCDPSSRLSALKSRLERVYPPKSPAEPPGTSSRCSPPEPAQQPELHLGSKPAVDCQHDIPVAMTQQKTSSDALNASSKEQKLSEKENRVSQSSEIRTHSHGCGPQKPGDLNATTPAKISSKKNYDKENIPPTNKVPVKKDQVPVKKDQVPEMIDQVAELTRLHLESRRYPDREILIWFAAKSTYALNGQFFRKMAGPDGTEIRKNVIFAIKSTPLCH